MKQFLFLKNMEIYVKLGCSEQEKYYKQAINIDLEIELNKEFNNIESDNIEKTICYYSLRNNIQKYCDKINCNLIESLGKKIYFYIKNTYSNINIKYLKLIKKPPISQIGLACFIIRN